ncbi:MAG: heterodisulfide reductase subunit B [Desulfobulbaceae bacterium]|nr:MAG: heterodisulfide reductase subunit B [Desulfobulbaceae bacterium]
MKLSYYPGCSLKGTAADYDRSVTAVCTRLGIELEEITDWNCCGASSAHMTNHEVGVRLPMRNLLLSMTSGHDILVPCAACFQRMKAADKSLRDNPDYWDVDCYEPDFEILHISRFLASEQRRARITELVKQPLADLKCACYYGCLSLRNPRITDAPDYEQPKSLERIVEAIGATPLRWSHRTECCSGSLTMARPDIAVKLVSDIVGAAKKAGAEALVTDCPMCQANVESRQMELEGQEPLPVFFATELILAAFEGTYPEKQQKSHLVSAEILAKVMSSAAHNSKEVI